MPALVAATLGTVTGEAVAANQLAAFFVGTSTLLTVVGTALALGLCLASQTSAKAGRSAEARTGDGRELARAAAVPTR